MQHGFAVAYGRGVIRRRNTLWWLGTLAAFLVFPLNISAQGREDRLDQPLMAANMCGAGHPGEAHFTLAATGDTFPHENIQAVGEAQGYDALFDHIRPFLKAADLAYTNFDGAMLEGGGYTGYPNFNYNPALAPALKNAGIGLVSTANNHILDRGPEGLDATLAVLERAGIAQHGAVASGAAQAGEPRPPYLPITLTRDGATLRVGFISATWGTNGIPDPHGQVNLLWESSEYGRQGGVRQSVLDAIAQARREMDIVVVAAHWGYEYQFYPDAVQIEGARRMAEAGADVILGAQSHTLQPVDLIEAGGRRALVIYSLANFIASQGAFQYPHYSATSVVFYVGMVRRPDGSAAVTGYRYLPTLVIDGDTRPAPLPPGESDVRAHVRLMMRDLAGAREVAADPASLGARVEVCPVVELPGVAQPVGGDFAAYYRTLGGAPRPPEEALAVLGAPLGPPLREASGDCARTVDVLYTENQRLELHPEADWPYRVVGTQLGAAAFQERYPGRPVERLTDIGAALRDERIGAFFERSGGLPVLGYPLSEPLSEADPATGTNLLVQYFERARLELDEASGAVRLGALGRAAADAPMRCPAGAAQAAQLPTSPTATREPTATPRGVRTRAQETPVATRTGPVMVRVPETSFWWGLWSLAALAIIPLAAAALWDEQRRRRELYARRKARRERRM